MATAIAAEPLAARGAMLPEAYRVVRRRRELADTWTLELEPAAGGAIDPLAPGQFTMLYAHGVGEVPISTSDTRDPRRIVHTIRDVGAVTHALCTAPAGGLLGVRGPFGNTWPLEEARGADVVVVAGGVGLPPLRPAVHRLLDERGQYGSVCVLYGGRSPRELIFRRELERWRSRLDVAVEVTVDTALADWRGRVGVVTKLIPRAPLDPGSAVAFVVGPEIMMRFAAQALLERGVAPERIFVSLERTMRCGIGLCGHCQLGPTLVCRDGPIYSWAEVGRWLEVPEL